MIIHSIEYEDKLYQLSERVKSEEGITLKDWLALAESILKTKSDIEILNMVKDIANKDDMLNTKLYEWK